MTRRERAAESGFTLVEVLISISLFAIVSVGFYQVMLSGTRAADTTRDVVEVSEQARAGFNRMVRDAREGNLAGGVAAPSATSFTVSVNYDGDGTPDENPNENGDYERVTYRYVAANRTIFLCIDAVCATQEPLITGVTQIGARPVFSYASNYLEYDTVPAGGDGVTTWQEVDAAVGVGNSSGSLDTTTEIDRISSVTFAFRVTVGNRSMDFFTEAQLRNRR